MNKQLYVHNIESYEFKDNVWLVQTMYGNHIVFANNESDAIDILVDSGDAKHLEVDEEFIDDDTCFAGNFSTPIDLDNVHISTFDNDVDFDKATMEVYGYEITLYTLPSKSNPLGYRKVYSYTFKDSNGDILFSGDDYSVGLLHSPLDTLVGILFFLTLTPDDVDEEYFKNYTSHQLEWVNSQDAHDLRMFCNDYENQE